MPNFTSTTTLTTGRGESLSASTSGTYEDVFNIRQQVNNTTTFITLLKGGSKSQGTLENCKSLIIRNAGIVGAEIQMKAREWTNATPDSNAGVVSNQLYLLGAGDYIYLPNFRQVNFQTNDSSGGDSYQLTNQAPDSNMYVDSTVDSTDGTGDDITGSASNTNLFLEDDGSTHLFHVGDLIRVNNEIMEVTAVGDDSDAANTNLTVIRGLYGSTAASDHADDAEIRFPFFNAYADFDKYSTAQTDSSGRFKAMNFFGYGRIAGGEATGLVPGSISGKFYEAGYQELGMSGVTASTATGLAASTAYAFDIAVDGGSDHTLTFTTDASDGTFGNLIRKIQAALDEQFYTTSSNLLKKGVAVAIVGGDIRFTSRQHLSTSAIAISAPASGTTPFGVGAFDMAVGAIEAAVVAKLPDDVIYDKKTNVSNPNTNAFFYDDGFGNINGVCTGTINYETGAIDLQGCPPNANFVVDANYGSAHSGGNNFDNSTANCIVEISGRSTNSKINTTIEVIGLN